MYAKTKNGSTDWPLSSFSSDIWRNSLKTEPNIQVWEYLWYAATTIFLLVVGVCLLFLRMLGWILRRLKKPGISWAMAGAVSLLVGILAISAISYLYFNSKDLGGQVIEVQVTTGDTFGAVADRLVKEGVVSNRWSLILPARLLKVDRKLRSGIYVFTGQNSARSVLDKLNQGDVKLTEVTIPEGMPIWKVAATLQTRLLLDSAALMQLNLDRPFLDSLEIPYLEGHLFPETYAFDPGVSLRSVVREMVQMFKQKTDSLWATQTATGLNKYQTLTLASIIEAETPLASERTRVASVYLNRLRIGMTLDADPTVIYGLGGLDRPLLRDDLDSVTIYNTYRIAGLPPTPINSPGLASVLAAMNPDGSDYLFFVADGTGGHIFSRTNEEHNMARRRARLNQPR
ncbi:MAG: endolytic transglycosylase MltG [bacterium]|nr:endolytic transglycosylase MltG [bacterium]